MQLLFALLPVLGAAAMAAGAAAQGPQVLPHLEPWGANSVRIRWSAPGGGSAASWGPFLDAALSHSAVSRGEGWLVHGNLRVTAGADGLVRASRESDGAVLLQQTGLGWGAAVGRGRWPSAQVELRGVGADETLVGMGQQKEGRVALERPFVRRFTESECYGYNQGRQALLPLWFSSRGYGVMWAVSGYGSLRLDRAGVVLNASSAAAVELWVSTTPGDAVLAAGSPHPLRALLSQYADAVGRPPLMPRFAAGFIASKDRYRNRTQLLAVARGYASRGIPLSVLTVDWFHWEHLGDMSLSRACWPDAAGMVAELRAMGVELMVSHWPYVSRESVLRAAFERAGALATNASSGRADTFWAYLQEGALVTTLSPATRALAKQSWKQGYGALGVRAVWLDQTEPDRRDCSWMDADGWDYEGVPASELGAAWRQQWLRAVAEALQETHGAGNYLLLARSAWLGTARFGHALWSGDTTSRWQDFREQIPAGLGAGLSGIGLWTSDLGGYQPGGLPAHEMEEMLVRWAQFAMVSPLMRLHGHRAGGPPDDPVCMYVHNDDLTGLTCDSNVCGKQVAWQICLGSFP
jgi:alpha-D-xyloside xylohydrolase